MRYDPIFKSIFGTQWNDLPIVMRKHYANRPYSLDVVKVEGKMEVAVSNFARLLTPLFRLSGALVPYAGNNIPVTVSFRSEPDSRAYCFDRTFSFPGKPLYRFRSRMMPIGGDEVIEYMPIGIGWRARYSYDGKKIIIEHRGYVVKLFGRVFRLPLELLMGSGYAEEEAMNNNQFRMYMDIRHFLFGRIYSYKGKFTLKEVSIGE